MPNPDKPEKCLNCLKCAKMPEIVVSLRSFFIMNGRSLAHGKPKIIRKYNRLPLRFEFKKIDHLTPSLSPEALDRQNTLTLVILGTSMSNPINQ